MARGKIPFVNSFPKFSSTVMGCHVVQLSHRYFIEGMKGNCFVGFHMTISLVSLDRGSRKLNYRRELWQVVFSFTEIPHLSHCQEMNCYYSKSISTIKTCSIKLH